MRRGEIALLVMLLVGAALWLVPVRGKPADHTEPSPPASAPSAPEPSQSAASSADAVPAGEGATLDRYRFDQGVAIRSKLSERLKEISGLALTPDGRLLAHDDEHGTVFEIDSRTGEIVKSFDLVDRRGVVAGDFEGIAVAGDHVYLITGDAKLYEAHEGGDGERVPCVVYDTGLGADYEFEGLAYEPRTHDLLLATKQARGKKSKAPLSIFRWSAETKRIADGAPIEIPVKEIASRIRGNDFNPSGIERDPVSGHYFLVAGIQHAIAELAPDGALVGVEVLPGEWHPQAEGITFGFDRSLILADEAAGKRSHLTLYPTALP